MHRDTKRLTDIMVYSLQWTQAHGPFSDLYPHVPLVETTGLFLLMKSPVPQKHPEVHMACTLRYSTKGHSSNWPILQHSSYSMF